MAFKCFVIWSPCLPIHFSECLSLSFFASLTRFQGRNSTSEQERLWCFLRVLLIKWLRQWTRSDLWATRQVSTFTWRSFRVLLNLFKRISASLLLSITHVKQTEAQKSTRSDFYFHMDWESLDFHCFVWITALFSQNNWRMYMKCGWKAGKKGNKNASLQGCTSVWETLLHLHINHCRNLWCVLKSHSTPRRAYQLKILQLNRFHLCELVFYFHD